MLVTVLTSILA